MTGDKRPDSLTCMDLTIMLNCTDSVRSSDIDREGYAGHTHSTLVSSDMHHIHQPHACSPKQTFHIFTLWNTERCSWKRLHNMIMDIYGSGTQTLCQENPIVYSWSIKKYPFIQQHTTVQAIWQLFLRLLISHKSAEIPCSKYVEQKAWEATNRELKMSKVSFYHI
jgi:hypothetical protein